MITAADLDRIPLFASLPYALRERIAARSADIRVAAGDTLAQEGDIPHFWAVLEGEVEALRLVSGKTRQATTFDPGEYFGEVPLMMGTTATLGIRALVASRLVRIDATNFHAFVAESSEMAAELAQTLVRRVNYIRSHAADLFETQATLIGDRFDVACHDVRDFLSRNHIVFAWLDPGVSTDVSYIPADVIATGTYPVVLLAGGARLVCPTSRELAAALGLSTTPAGGRYDVAIVGGGPAGLSAGVYGGSEGLRTLLIEREATGGQAGTSSRIENYLGFPGGVTGDDLAMRALQQAQRFGTEILITQCVSSVRPGENEHTVVFDDGEEIVARALVVASGVTWRTLEIDGASRLVDRGIYYGAARTEALGTRGQDIFLIGDGNSAGQAAMNFADFARSVTILVRGDALARTMSRYLIEQLRTEENISVETATSVVAIEGKERLEAIVTRTGGDAPRRRPAQGLFAFIGADAHTSWLPGEMERDARGYLRTGRDLETWPLSSRAPYQLETSIPGIFAAGDVRSDSIKRVASAVGEGSIVIAFVHQYLECLNEAEHAIA